MMVALSISQPMRAKHCLAYAASLEPEDRAVVYTADPTPFRVLDLPAHVEIELIATHPEARPTPFLDGPVTRRLIRWMRAGSDVGIRVERLLRQFAWRLRYIGRMAVIARRARSTVLRSNGNLTSAPIGEALNRAHRVAPIHQVVVFDLFDLPAVMEFAEVESIEVLVR